MNLRSHPLSLHPPENYQRLLKTRENILSEVDKQKLKEDTEKALFKSKVEVWKREVVERGQKTSNMMYFFRIQIIIHQMGISS